MDVIGHTNGNYERQNVYMQYRVEREEMGTQKRTWRVQKWDIDANEIALVESNKILYYIINIHNNQFLVDVIFIIFRKVNYPY